MLFNSPEFIFVFLPLCLFATYLALRRWGFEGGIVSLIFCSAAFYAWWNYFGVAIIAASIGGNFLIASLLLRAPPGYRVPLVTLGVACNLLALGYFKYRNFFASMVGAEHVDIILPLAISFYTFQQIAFIVDIYRGKLSGLTLRDYSASVLFFPHLIAGPLIHYGDIIKQLRSSFKVSSATIAAGLLIFAVGLAKKTAIADPIAMLIDPIYAKAQHAEVELVQAWVAALGYSAQLYFDFSGYSDMAIGLAVMFGIILPINFNSPYKATSIIDFWRRWHITLSNFLRDYLYIPLGGSRVASSVRRYGNLIAVMLLGGLWHGAGWTFVVWGGLHGAYLLVNHGWRSLVGPLEDTPVRRFAGWALTFLAVVIAWVFFRSPDFTTARNLVGPMFGSSFCPARCRR